MAAGMNLAAPLVAEGGGRGGQRSAATTHRLEALPARASLVSHGPAAPSTGYTCMHGPDAVEAAVGAVSHHVNRGHG